MNCPKCGEVFDGQDDAPPYPCPACSMAWSSATRIIAALLTCGATVDVVAERLPGVDRRTLVWARRTVEGVCHRLTIELRRSC